MILVTGGTGLLGSHLLYYLVKSDPTIKIRATYRKKEKIKEVQFLFDYLNRIEMSQVKLDSIEWVNCDLLNLDHLNLAFENIQLVYHCAAKVSFYKTDYSDCLKHNVFATRNIVNACLSFSIEKLCYVSSTAAVGENPMKPSSESDKWSMKKNTSGYSISKYKAELEVWRGVNEGLKATIINPCIILGAGNWNRSSMSIFKTVSRGLKFFSPGSNAIVDARDVANCMILMMNSDIHSERFLCIGQNISYQHLFSEIAKTLNVPKPKYKIPFLMAKIGASIIEFIQIFKFKKSGISKEMVNSSYRNVEYNNEKIKHYFNIEFRSLNDTLTYSANGKHFFK